MRTCGFLLIFLLIPQSLLAAETNQFWDDIRRILTFQDYNTRVVFLGTTALGIVGGLVGTFMLLRKRALLSDAISHATLPGIALVFLIAVAWGYDGKNLELLLIGAALSGTIGMMVMAAIIYTTRLPDDAALGIVLSVFFGIGAAFLGIAQRVEGGSAAGLETFIYGKTASMLLRDAVLIAVTATATFFIVILFHKEFAIICFDSGHAASLGLPVRKLDFLMMSLVVIVTVIGLQAVGLILVIAILVIPPAAARFWSHRLGWTLFLAALFGGLSGFIGTTISALAPRLPAGAVVVLVASSFFFVSFLFGAERGILKIWIRERELRQRLDRQELLLLVGRLEQENVTFDDLLRNWSNPRFRLKSALQHAIQSGQLKRDKSSNAYRVTDDGKAQILRLQRNFTLWQVYLLSRPDSAPNSLDRDVNALEDLIGEGLISELEKRALEPEIREKLRYPDLLKSVGGST